MAPSNYHRFAKWRIKHLPHRYFMLLLALGVGLASGFATVIIKNTVFGIRYAITHGFSESYANYLYFCFPFIGLLLTLVIIRYLIREEVGHGIPNVLYAISKNNCNMSRKSMFASILTSTITVGFGGSVGLEGPTVSTSAAVGSNIGRLLHFNRKSKNLLLGCAAAGALSAIFKAPIAAIIFAIEVIMLDLTTASLIPLLLSSVSAFLISILFLGRDSLFHVQLSAVYDVVDIPFLVGLGILTGLVSLYFTRVYFGINKLFEKLSNPFVRVIVAGAFLGSAVFFMPVLFGEGYKMINGLINGNTDVLFEQSPFFAYKDNVVAVFILLAAIILVKAVATSATFSAGGIGGIFAPSLFLGSGMGFGFSSFINHLGIVKLSQTNYTLVGMAGIMAGVLQAPLTGIFLIAEITGGYTLFIPLMITAAVSFLTIRIFQKHSVYTMQLAERGELITHHKDHAILTLMRLEQEIERDFISIRPTQKLGDLVKVITKSKRNLFPVVDVEDKFIGYVTLNDVRDIMFEREKYEDTFVEDLMVAPPCVLDKSETMESVMEKFERTGAWNLPVVSDGQYLGFVSRSKLFNAYRKRLREFYEE